MASETLSLETLPFEKAIHESIVVVDGVSLSVKRAGRGPQIVCLTAVGHDAHDFAPLAMRIRDRYELVCIEWPSHGDSGSDREPARAWWYRYAFALYYRLVLPRPEAEKQRRRIVARAYTLATVLREAWASFGEQNADIRAIAARLDIPIWVAWAKHDRVIPLQKCRPAIDRLRRASVTTFDAGHTPFLEQPDAFTEGFSAFVESLASPGANAAHV